MNEIRRFGFLVTDSESSSDSGNILIRISVHIKEGKTPGTKDAWFSKTLPWSLEAWKHSQQNLRKLLVSLSSLENTMEKRPTLFKSFYLSKLIRGASNVHKRCLQKKFRSECLKHGSTYSVLHIVAYSPIFKDFVSHVKCATYCVLHFFNVK